MKNKPLMLLLSFVLSFGIWLYVVNYVSLDSEDTFYNIPVALTGESALVERGMMITGGRNATVTLKLSGKRADLNKLSSANITVEADLSKIYDVGDRVELEYNVRYPGGMPQTAFEILSQEPGVITLSVDEYEQTSIPVRVDYGGTTQAEGYMAELEEAVLSEEYISVAGPKTIVDQISKAVIYVDLTDRTETISEEFRYTLCTEEGEPVDLKELVTVDDDGMVRLDLKILKLKTVPLWINVINGGGATQETSTILIDPETIEIAGNAQVLEKIERIELVGEIKLGEIEGETTLTFALNIPDNVVNISGLTEVPVTISFPNLQTKVLNVTKFVAINVPEGMEAVILTKELPITVRGPVGLIRAMTASDVTVVVDFSNAALGTATVKASIEIDGKYVGVGEMDTYSVTATLRIRIEEET